MSYFFNDIGQTNKGEKISSTKENESTAFDPRKSKTLDSKAPNAIEAANSESTKEVQIIDLDTRPEDVKEERPGKPVPLILDPSERPIDDVFQNIVNFRDVGGYVNQDTNTEDFKPLRFFRSGRLDDANTADLDLMKTKYNIRCVIDLRSEGEGRMGEALVNTFPASAITEQLKAKEIVHPPLPHHTHLHNNESEVTKLETENENDKQGGARITYFINFAGRRFRYYAVWKPLSVREKAKMMYLMATGRRAEAIQYIGQTIVLPRGLIGLNQNFVDNCGNEIVQAIKLMANKLHYPILVHCTQGKDRTGLVVALVLTLCDVKDEFIIKDYARTQKGLARQRDVMIVEMRKTGLDPSFSDAPPEIMEKTLEYIRTKYSSTVQYLFHHGLTNEDVVNIRTNLMRNK